MTMGPEYKNFFAVFDVKEQKYILADSGLTFKSVDPATAQAAIDRMKADGADVSNLRVVEWPDLVDTIRTAHYWLKGYTNDADMGTHAKRILENALHEIDKNKGGNTL